MVAQRCQSQACKASLSAPQPVSFGRVLEDVEIAQHEDRVTEYVDEFLRNCSLLIIVLAHYSVPAVVNIRS